MFFSDFPSLPLLFPEVEGLVARAHDLQTRIEAQLGRKEVDKAVLEALNEEVGRLSIRCLIMQCSFSSLSRLSDRLSQKNDLSVILPTDPALNAVNNKLIFLEAHGMATAGAERIAQGLAESLCTEGREVTLSSASDDASAASTLGSQLDVQVQAAIDRLEALVQSAAAARESISPEMLTG